MYMRTSAIAAIVLVAVLCVACTEGSAASLSRANRALFRGAAGLHVYHTRKLMADREYPQRGNQGFETSSSYIQAVALTALVGAIIAVTCCVLGLCTCCIKSCQNRAAKKDPYYTSDLCCTSDVQKQAQRGLIIIGCVLIGAGVVIGLVANRTVSQGVHDFTDTIMETIGTVKEKEQEIVTDLYEIDPTLDYRDLTAEVQKVEDAATQAQQMIFSIDTVRVILVFFSFYFALVTAAVGFTAGIFAKSNLAKALMIMGFSTLFIIWLSYGLHLPVSIYADDMCVSVDNYLENGDSNSPTLNYFLKCMQSDQYQTTLNQALDKTTAELATLNKTTTELIGYSFDPTISNGTGSVESRLSDLIGKAGDIVKQVDARLQNVTDSRVQQIRDVVNRIQLLIVVAQDLLELLRCDYMKAFIDNLRNILCEDMRGGLTLILVAIYIIGLTAIPLTFLAAFVLQRFDSLNQYSKERITLEAMCLIEILLGFVAIGLFSTDITFTFIIGLAAVAVPLLGFFGSFYVKKWVIAVFAAIQSMFVLAGLVMIIVYSLAIHSCSQPSCTLSDKLDYIVSLTLMCILVFPILISTAAAWRFYYHFEEIKATPTK